MTVRLFVLSIPTLVLLVPTSAAAAQTTLSERVAARRAARIQEEQTIPTSPSSTLSSETSHTMAARAAARRAERLHEAVMQNTPQPEDSSDRVIKLTNNERLRRGLTALKPNELLSRSAQQYAEYLDRENFFSHEGPDGSTTAQRIRATGYGVIDTTTCRCHYETHAGENLARGQESPEKAVSDWMNSPSHRDAILMEEFKEIGVGVSGDVWVQHFGGTYVQKVFPNSVFEFEYNGSTDLPTVIVPVPPLPSEDEVFRGSAWYR